MGGSNLWGGGEECVVKGAVSGFYPAQYLKIALSRNLVERCPFKGVLKWNIHSSTLVPGVFSSLLLFVPLSCPGCGSFLYVLSLHNTAASHFR